MLHLVYVYEQGLFINVITVFGWSEINQDREFSIMFLRWRLYVSGHPRAYLGGPGAL